MSRGHTSVFFNNFGASSEQTLMEDLVIESISIFGVDFYYIPRTLNNYDDIYGSDDISTYDKAIQIVMYVKSYEKFEGDGNLMSKFGLEIRDQVTFTIATRIFNDEITPILGINVPNSGDLIYYPLDKKLFQIKYVEKKVFHYPMGMLPTFDIYCELFEYSQEGFDTGIPEVDKIQTDYSINALDWALVTEDGKALTTESGDLIIREDFDQNLIDPADNISEIADVRQSNNGLIDFTEINPWSEEFNSN